MLFNLAKLLRLLNSEADPGQVSLAIGLSMVMGFTPPMSLHNLLVLFLVLILRVNLSAFLLCWPFFTALSFALDPLFHRIGLAVLTAPALEGLWTTLYNSTLWRIERFNNSIVMGSLVVSLLLLVPLVLLVNQAILRYREQVLARIKDTWVFKAIESSKFYGYYQSLSRFGGEL
ncbi:MAG: TIGR03546 family protein [Nitrospirota bacterium]